MPKIRITEVDNTGSSLALRGSHTVYIPGATSDSAKKAAKLYENKAALLKDVSELSLVNDLSFKMACRLLDLGLPVLYQAFPLNGGTQYADGNFNAALVTQVVEQVTTTTFEISGVTYTLGTNQISWNSGTESDPNIQTAAITNGKVNLGIPSDAQVGFTVEQVLTFDFVEQLVNYTVKKISTGTSISILSADWAALEDKNLYDIRFLTTGGYAENMTSNMVSTAAHRGDCVALIDHENFDTYTVAAVREAIEALDTGYAGKNSDNALSFAAAFTPWFTAKWTEGDTTVEEEFPASFGYLLAFARSVQKNPMWKAVAGSFRGSIAELTKVNYELTTAEVEVLQARATTGEVELDERGDNVGMSINPIALENPYGYLIWGDRTLRNNTGTLVATSSLHSRVLVTEINKLLYQSAKKYTFEQNTDVLWINFKSEVTPTLEQMKSGEGIGDYKWSRLATSARARLKARIAITPIDCAEDFDLEISMEDSIDVAE